MWQNSEARVTSENLVLNLTRQMSAVIGWLSVGTPTPNPRSILP